VDIQIPIKIRTEIPAGYPAITEINDLAFGQPGEGKLVENLRKNPKFSPALSLVAKPMEEYLAISSFPR
jgi:putative acetyltransferase